MEEHWYADWCRLRDLLRVHPDWTKRQLADGIGRSIGWVKKWRRRLQEAAPEDLPGEKTFGIAHHVLFRAWRAI